MAATIPDFITGFGLPSSRRELVLGTFNRRLTVFDQQIRALNLAYRLHRGNLYERDKPIAVVGGGIAGLTFAAGSLWLGHKVLLLEKQPVLCHLQRGCDIRWIHPHIYNWPRPGAEQPYAALPLLSWAEGTASEVARQIIQQWEHIGTAVGESLIEVLSANFELLSRNPLRIKWEGRKNNQSTQDVTDASHIVYAVGFGVEQGRTAVIAHSYWENDSFNQLRPDHPPGEKIKWLVSGVGDGALVDLQRLTIESFRQGRVVQELFVNQNSLLDDLRTLQRQTPTATFFESLRALKEAGRFEFVDTRLRQRLRHDTDVRLNSRQVSFDIAINRSDASFLNRFIAHRLHEVGAFKYVAGELWNVERHRNRKGSTYGAMLVDSNSKIVRMEECDRLVLRHGTERHTWLKRAGYRYCDELAASIAGDTPRAEPEWEPGWWAREVYKPVLQSLRQAQLDSGSVIESIVTTGHLAEVTKKRVADTDPSPREFITPVTEAVGTTFVRTLAGLIEHSAGDHGISFRLALHRVVPLNGRLRLQQISEYAGTRPDDSADRTTPSAEWNGSAMQSGKVGRVFDVNHLTIGLCVRARRPCLLRSKVAPGQHTASDLKEDMTALHIDNSYARHMNSTVRAVLTIPFYGATWTVDDKEMANLVLYLDSDNVELMSREIINQVHAACISFRNHLDVLTRVSEGGFRAVSWDLASAPGSDLQKADEAIKGLKAFVDGPADYHSLMIEGADTLKFDMLDVVDLVSGTA